MKKIHTCQCCGHTTREYRHKLNKAMITALYQLYRRGVPSNLQKELVLTKNQYNNFQKLQYFKLVERVVGTSLWKVTELGNLFCDGSIGIPNTAYTFGKTILSKDVCHDDIITIDDYPDIVEHYRKRENYLKD